MGGEQAGVEDAPDFLGAAVIVCLERAGQVSVRENPGSKWEDRQGGVKGKR